ncbi:uncharacterized protein LOC110178370 [Drosophila serrata]|uniref:uncharacterized protein LOC110178370 n=1 Tax=Drosophila serrata TaxID=7274 RepID=UPI000A1CF5CB|nr:uncharacterized protein LOC110178370 [Drosophila serrata]
MFIRRSPFVQLMVFLYLINRFTNVKCVTLDPEFDEFEYCFLKSVNRTYKYMSLKVNLLKKPITKIKINVALLKRYSGYRPFLYNITVDACRFVKNPSSNPIAGFIYSLFKSHSNINGSCPVAKDVIVEKLPVDFINTKLTKVLPFPHGDFLFHSNWIAYDINRATVDVYFTLS